MSRIEELKKEIEGYKREYDNPIMMGRDMKVRLLLIEKEAELKGRLEQKQEDIKRFLKVANEADSLIDFIYYLRIP